MFQNIVIFIITKKIGTVWFISVFIELKEKLRRKKFPIPKIQELLLKLIGFKYSPSLDLNKGYSHIKLCPFQEKMCTIILSWGKYEYQKLPMGLTIAQIFFKKKWIISLMV